MSFLLRWFETTEFFSNFWDFKLALAKEKVGKRLSCKTLYLFRSGMFDSKYKDENTVLILRMFVSVEPYYRRFWNDFIAFS